MISEAAILAFLALLPALAAGFFHPEVRIFNRQKIAADELSLVDALNRQPGVLWIDARPASDFAKGHVPGAILLNEDDWSNLLPAVLERWATGQTAVVYCSSLRCESSHQVARRLRDFAVGPVYVLEGGWESWLASQK